MKNFLSFFLFFYLAWSVGLAHAKMSVANTEHNLSSSGPGQVKAFSEDRICIFCHTPHNGEPATPLWNKAIDPQTYTLYESSTLDPRIISSRPARPTGPSRLCLSCHDGMLALNKLKLYHPRPGQPQEPSMTQDYVDSSLGLDLSNDHPFNFSYYDALPDTELHPSPPAGLLFYGTGEIHCSTCHDAHDDTNDMFLAVDNRFSALCTKCHIKEGWSSSTHRTSTSTWNGVLPNPWPHNASHSPGNQWNTVSENGCQNCHVPHGAGGPQRLVRTLAEEENCFPCHNGNVALTNIEAQFDKASIHPVRATTIGSGNAHDPTEEPTLISGHVECVDCHAPCAVQPDISPPQPPYASARLLHVSGVDRNGNGLEQITYEYEVCFKCHADSAQGTPVVQRVIEQNNTRLEFDTANPSYHPVVGQGQNPDMPSLPNTAYDGEMSASSLIYCTDCHDNDDSPKINGTGPKGPHGSSFAPLLREPYLTADFTVESDTSYALCYRCHLQQSILADQSFPFHYRHLKVVSAPCAACHDPHGAQSDGGLTGDHTHLINFATLIVSPYPGQTVPFFTDNLSRAGSCTLVCHGKTHVPDYTGTDPNFVNSSYP